MSFHQRHRPAYSKPSPTRAQQRCAVQMVLMQRVSLDLDAVMHTSLCRSYDIKPAELDALIAAEKLRRVGR